MSKLDEIVRKFSLPIIRDQLDQIFNGVGFFSPRKEILDISKLSDEQVEALWIAGNKPDDLQAPLTEKDKEIERLKDELNLALHAAGAEAVWLNEATAENKIMREALEKIEDPRKRDHKEPDAYTQLGCVMHIATEALARIRKGQADE